MTQIGRFRTVTPAWIRQWLWNDAQSLKRHRIGALLFFNVIRQISRSHGTKRLLILTRSERFRTVTPVWIHPWPWNDAQCLMLLRRGVLLFFQGHQSNFKVARLKIVNFDSNLVFPGCNSSLNSQKAMKWCTGKLEAKYKRCPIVFQGHQSNFKVTRDKKLPNLTLIERFRTVTQVWLHRWIWNDAKSWCSIEEVSYCFPRSSIKFQGHTGQNIANFDPNWAFPDNNSSLNSPMDLKWCTKLDVV